MQVVADGRITFQVARSASRLARPVEWSWGRACSVGLLSWLPACSEAAAPGDVSLEDVPSEGRAEGGVRIWRVERSLLLDRAARTVAYENGERPVSVELLKPLVGWGEDRHPKASLVMAPPAEVSYRLPEGLHPEATLHVERGFGAGAYEATSLAKVRFEVLVDGELVASHVDRVGEQVRPDRRSWRPLDIAVGGARKVTLRTTLEAPGRDTVAPAQPLDAAFALLELAVPEQVHPHPASSSHPNVLVILIDTLRPDRLGVYGYARDTSPVIDGLARRGTVFEQAYAPSSWTWPSTASLLTGQAPPEHGLESAQSCFLSDELTTLAEALRSRGLATVGFSANPLVSSARNFDQGFETFREYRRTRAAEMLPDIEEWLRANGDRRFFMYLHWFDPHGPYEPDETLAEGLLLPAPEGYYRGVCRETLERKLRGEPHDPELLTRFTPYVSALYDGEVATVDHATGRLLGLLEELGLDGRTIVVLTSDHGEEFLEHGLNGHGKQLYEESVRVPLILAGPGIPQGERVAGAVAMLHLAPTLVRLAGGGAGSEDRELAGPDLLQEARSPTNPPLFFSVMPGRWPDASSGAAPPVAELRAMRAGRWQLIWAPAEEGRADDLVRLFDLERDPRAREDVAPANGPRVREMQDAVTSWLERCAGRRPTGLAGGAETLELLRQLGYFDDD